MRGSKEVTSPQRQVALLSLAKDGGAAPVLTGLCAVFCTIEKLGVGSYKIVTNIKRPFNQVGQIVCGLRGGVGFIVKDIAGGDASDKLQVKVDCFDVDGVTPKELDFDMLITGSFALDLQG